MFDTKIAMVVLADLAMWQKLNIVAFCSSGVAVSEPDLTGEPYEDASGNAYLPMFRQPVLVFQADPGQIRKAFDRAMEAGLKPAIFTLTCSRRATTRPTGPRSRSRPRRNWNWSASP